MEKRKKGIAPDEVGELPNELRCKQCWRLLSQIATNDGSRKYWCLFCNLPVK